jgi:hypothetical protein
MYIAVTATIVGQALLLGQFGLLASRRCSSRPRWRLSPCTRSRRYAGSLARNTTRTAPPFRAGGNVYTPGVGSHQARAAPANRTCGRAATRSGDARLPGARGLRHLLRTTRASSGAADAPCNARQWRPAG